MKRCWKRFLNICLDLWKFCKFNLDVSTRYYFKSIFKHFRTYLVDCLKRNWSCITNPTHSVVNFSHFGRGNFVFYEICSFRTLAIHKFLPVVVNFVFLLSLPNPVPPSLSRLYVVYFSHFCLQYVLRLENNQHFRELKPFKASRTEPHLGFQNLHTISSYLIKKSMSLKFRIINT